MDIPQNLSQKDLNPPDLSYNLALLGAEGWTRDVQKYLPTQVILH